MFIFKFSNRLQWCYGRLFKNEDSILWKITISGPFVTLYSTNEYANIIGTSEKKYGFVLPFFLEHTSAHGENIIEGVYPPELRDWHSHITLPCEKNLVEELKDLLELIAKHNQPDKKLIDSDLIAQCVETYRNYLNTASLDGSKNNATNLLLKWIAPYQNDFLFLNSLKEENQDIQEVIVPSTQDLFTLVNQYLEIPNQKNYEILRAEGCYFFKILNRSKEINKKEIINEIFDFLPRSSTHLFNSFVNKHLYFVFGSLLTSSLSGLLLLNSFGLDNFTVPYALFLLLYAPALTEKFYTIVSKWIDQEDYSSQDSTRYDMNKI